MSILWRKLWIVPTVLSALLIGGFLLVAIFIPQTGPDNAMALAGISAAVVILVVAVWGLTAVVWFIKVFLR